MRKDLELLENEIRTMKGLLSEVHQAIIGNPLTKDGGIAMRLFQTEAAVERLEENLMNAERRLESRTIENEKKQIKYALQTKVLWGVLGTTAGLILAYIFQLIVLKR